MRENLPFFSVIIPTYRRAQQLAACIGALAALDYPRERFEVIVVDDGSGSPPEKVVESFRHRLDAKLLEQEHAGPSAARNTGAARARGEFLAFTDDDCAPDAGWLGALARRLSAAPERAVGGRTLNALTRNPYAATSQMIHEVVYSHYNPDPDAARFFASNNFALSAGNFHALGGFDETFLTAEDREFCDRFLQRGFRMVYAPEAIVYHAHNLNLRRLWRQHFGYGRGARRFHDKREARGEGRFRPEREFYLKLLRAPFAAESKKQSPMLAALLAWVQLANAAGFFYERVRPTHGQRPIAEDARRGETKNVL